jgi:serine/threonine protein kinase
MTRTTPSFFELIMRGQYSFPKPYWNNISLEAQDLVRRLLTVDAGKRLSATEALQHRWIASGGSGGRLLAQEAMAKMKAYNDSRKHLHTRPVISPDPTAHDAASNAGPAPMDTSEPPLSAPASRTANQLPNFAAPKQG